LGDGGGIGLGEAGAEGLGMADQEPPAGGNERDAAGLGGFPDDDVAVGLGLAGGDVEAGQVECGLGGGGAGGDGSREGGQPADRIGSEGAGDGIRVGDREVLGGEEEGGGGLDGPGDAGGAFAVGGAGGGGGSGTIGEAEDGGRGEEPGGAGGAAGTRRHRLGEQLDGPVDGGGGVGGGEGELGGLFRIGVGQDEHRGRAVGPGAEEGEDGRARGADAAELRAVEEGGVGGEELVEGGEFGDDVAGAVPGEAGALVDDDFFLGEPFDAGGEAVAAADAGEGAEAVAEQGPVAAAGGEAFVVVGLAVVDVGADGLGLGRA
jgi:hypothetical protein